MREGRLGYNCENGRYGLLSMDLWIDTGFHCGECMEVLVDDQWVKTRMEMNLAREWYLVGTPYCGDLEYVWARIPEYSRQDKPGYGQIKRADTPKMKNTSRNMVQKGSTL